MSQICYTLLLNQKQRISRLAARSFGQTFGCKIHKPWTKKEKVLRLLGHRRSIFRQNVLNFKFPRLSSRESRRKLPIQVGHPTVFVQRFVEFDRGIESRNINYWR